LKRRECAHDGYLTSTLSGDEVVALEKVRFEWVHRSGRILADQRSLDLLVQAKVVIIGCEMIFDLILFSLRKLAQ
jgi:hypothetical protein